MFFLALCLVVGLVAKLCVTLVTPWTVACQAPLSMGLSRQEYWSGLPFPSTGDFPDPRINLGLLHYRQILYQLSYKGSPALCLLCELFSNDFFKDFTHLNESTSIMPDSSFLLTLISCVNLYYVNFSINTRKIIMHG